MEQSLNSIIHAFKRGIIGYNDCDDGSEEIIINFCKNNKNFIPHKYPYSFDTIINKTKNEKMVDYSNWVLSFVPKNEWVMKIDVDQIYNSNILLKTFKDNKINDCIVPTRLNLHYDGKKLYVLYKKYNTFLDDADHWCLYNNNLEFIDCNPKDRNITAISSCENLSNNGRRLVYKEISSFHFPFVKANRIKQIDYDNIMPFDNFLKNEEGLLSKIKRNKTYICDEKLMYNKDYILSFCNKFNI